MLYALLLFKVGEVGCCCELYSCVHTLTCANAPDDYFRRTRHRCVCPAQAGPSPPQPAGPPEPAGPQEPAGPSPAQPAAGPKETRQGKRSRECGHCPEKKRKKGMDTDDAFRIVQAVLTERTQPLICTQQSLASMLCAVFELEFPNCRPPQLLVHQRAHEVFGDRCGLVRVRGAEDGAVGDDCVVQDRHGLEHVAPELLPHAVVLVAGDVEL